MRKSCTILVLLLLPVFLAAQVPVFYLTFDHMDDSDVEVYDAIGELIGTASGEISDGIYGDGFSLNGSDGFIHFSDAVIDRGTFTMTVWFNVSTHIEESALMQTDGPEEGGAVFILMYPDGMECFANNNSGEQAYWAEAAVPTEAWVHLAMVVDTENEMVTIYADGEEVGAGSGSFSLEEDKPLIGPFSIGAHSPDGGSFSRNWAGIVDEFRLYDVALTAEEVLESMEEYDLEGVGVKNRDTRSVRIYPNPSFGMITLDQDFETIAIFNISGQKITEMEDYRTGTQINVTDLGKGLYILKATSAGIEITEKLVIR